MENSKKKIELIKSFSKEMRKNIFSASVTDKETIKTMQDLFSQKKII